MKKIVALLLTLGLIAPSFASAVDEILPGSGRSTGGVSTGPSFVGSSDPTTGSAASIAAAAAAGRVVGCHTGGQGGAAAQQYSKVSQNSKGLVQGLLQKGLSQISGGAGPLSGIINQVGGLAISKLAPELEKALGGVLGGQGGQLIGALLSGNPGQIISGILGGSGGLGGILSGGGLGNILGGGGGLGGILSGGGLGGIVSGLSGGSAVPVKEIAEQLAEIKKINKQTFESQKLNETLVQKECLVDPVTKKIAQQLAAETRKATFEWYTNEKLQIENPAQFLGEAVAVRREGYFKNDVESINQEYRGTIVAILKSEEEQGDDFAKKLGSELSENALKYLRGDEDVEFSKALIELGFGGVNGPISQLLIAQEQLQQVKHAARINAELLLNQNQFSKPTFEDCKDGSKPKGGQCPEGPAIVKVPGELIDENISDEIASAKAEVREADEVGEVPDEFTALLSQAILQGLNGIAGLLQSQGEEGSYLDQSVGNATTESNAIAGGAVAGDIAASIALEEEYLFIVEGAVEGLATTTAAYKEAIKCYQQKVGAYPDFQTRIQTASTTITAILKPNTDALIRLQTEGGRVISLLYDFLDRLEGAGAQEIITVNAEYSALIESGQLHTDVDVTLLENEFLVTADAIALLALDAAAQLAECKSL